MNVEQPETLVMIESIVYKSNGFAIDICHKHLQKLPNLFPGWFVWEIEALVTAL
ncbi:hypothetical protein [Microcoleus sp. S13C4]|uniref:hypothetical protein n=1 Tax=Microcoleus sp. S13C4 TaxID=3055410 RepID=UPI002FD10A48